MLSLLNLRFAPHFHPFPVEQLVPLKRYGNYPPESREKCTPEDDGGSDSDVPVRAGRGKETEGKLSPAVVKLKHSVVDEGPSSLKIVVEVCVCVCVCVLSHQFW